MCGMPRCRPTSWPLYPYARMHACAHARMRASSSSRELVCALDSPCARLTLFCLTLCLSFTLSQSTFKVAVTPTDPILYGLTDDDLEGRDSCPFVDVPVVAIDEPNPTFNLLDLKTSPIRVSTEKGFNVHDPRSASVDLVGAMRAFYVCMRVRACACVCMRVHACGLLR